MNVVVKVGGLCQSVSSRTSKDRARVCYKSSAAMIDDELVHALGDRTATSERVAHNSILNDTQ